VRGHAPQTVGCVVSISADDKVVGDNDGVKARGKIDAAIIGIRGGQRGKRARDGHGRKRSAAKGEQLLGFHDIKSIRPSPISGSVDLLFTRGQITQEATECPVTFTTVRSISKSRSSRWTVPSSGISMLRPWSNMRIPLPGTPTVQREDRLLDMLRTVVNVTGHSVAPV